MKISIPNSIPYQAIVVEDRGRGDLDAQEHHRRRRRHLERWTDTDRLPRNPSCSVLASSCSVLKFVSLLLLALFPEAKLVIGARAAHLSSCFIAPPVCKMNASIANGPSLTSQINHGRADCTILLVHHPVRSGTYLLSLEQYDFYFNDIDLSW